MGAESSVQNFSHFGSGGCRDGCARFMFCYAGGRRLDARGQAERRMPYDSSTAKIVNRLHEHELRTIPVIEKRRKEHEVTDNDGTGTPDEVFARLRAAVESSMHKAR